MKEVSTPNDTGFDTSGSNPNVERVETLLRGGFDTGFDTSLGTFVENEFPHQTTPVSTLEGSAQIRAKDAVVGHWPHYAPRRTTPEFKKGPLRLVVDLEGWSAFRSDVKANHNSCRTSGAFPKGKSRGRIGFLFTALQDGFLAFLIALSAKPMRRFGALCLWLQNVSKRDSVVDIFQFVALLFSVPCFQISYLFFQITCALQQRRALILSRKRGIIGVNQLALKFDELRLEGCSIPQRYHRLRDIRLIPSSEQGFLKLKATETY